MTKKLLSVLVLIAVLLTSLALFSSCGSDENKDDSSKNTANSTVSQKPSDPASSKPSDKKTPENNSDESKPALSTSEVSKPESNASNAEKEPTTVSFQDNTADIVGSGATFKNGVLSVTEAGSYILSGTLASGCVEVNVAKTEKVELVLNGVSITNPAGPAIFCDSADELVIEVKKGTTNTLKDGEGFVVGDSGPNATVFCDDDLTIKGKGTLKVIAIANNGISSKNDITIKNVTLSIEAKNTAIRGKYSVTVQSGTINITCGNDGIKSTETKKEGKGFVLIESGELTISAGDDAIQAETLITVKEGTVIKATAKGKKANAPEKEIAEGVFQ